MAKVYKTRCVVKRNGKYHNAGTILSGLTEKEIRQGIAERWLEAVGEDDGGARGGLPKSSGKGKDKKGKGKEEPEADDLDGMAVGELVAKAIELGLEADNSMAAEALRGMIREAEAEG